VLAHKQLGKLLGATLSIGLAFIGLSSAPVLAANPSSNTSGVEISVVGQRAFTDLSTCLASGKSQALDVFYLVDSSGSLSYTDKNEVRKTVIENSVSQLKNFSDQGVAVSFAAALFSDSVKPIQNWSKLSSPSSFDRAVDVISRNVNNDKVGGYTDWEEGLNFASDSLSERPKDSCKMLIWLTDGGINPTGDPRDTLDSLKRLCHPRISSDSLKNNSTTFGIFNTIRKQQISIFGVLYQNDKSSLEQFEQDYEDGRSEFTADERIELEHYLMSYMVPLVEGSGQIMSSKVATSQGLPPGGKLECAPVDEAGFAPAGQPNGAFLRAQDPVSLAFQFLKMQAVLDGGNGNQIVDGKFEVPKGTASFRVLTTSKKWHLIGPGPSKVDQKDGKNITDPNLTVSQSAGVYQLDYRVGSDSNLLGEWKFDAPGGESWSYLYSGLTMVLDRDRTSQVVSDRENTLTGQVIRKKEFSDIPVDLSVFDSHNLSLSTSDANGNLKKIEGVKIDLRTDGSFKVEGYVPAKSGGREPLWLTLELGGKFEDVSSKFEVSVVAKSDIATVQNSVIKLSRLEGPEGIAKGKILVSGPTSVDSSEYCIDEKALRTTDAQTAAQKHPRDEKFAWKFSSSAASNGLCFEIPQGKTVEIGVEVTNPIQADSHVVSVRGSKSTSGAADLEENLQFEFDSGSKTDPFVEWAVIIGLLMAGLLIPLGLLYLLNFVTTKFLPISQMVRADYQVQVHTGPVTKILDQKGNQISVDANDFKFLADQPASRSLDLGQKGKSVARLPIFPLAATWFEHQAPVGSRVISIYSGGSKNPNHFTSGKATEISPNHADNWQLIVPDAEFAKADGEQLNATLVIGTRMANLPQYQSRVNEISSKPGLQRRISEIRAAIAAESATPQKASKISKAGKGRGPDSSGGSLPGGGTPVIPPTQPSSPSIPGVSNPTPTTPGVTVIPGVTPPAAPSIPGVPKPPTIPGVNPPK
jgi:von Willebrand factor type A domain